MLSLQYLDGNILFGDSVELARSGLTQVKKGGTIFGRRSLVQHRLSRVVESESVLGRHCVDNIHRMDNAKHVVRSNELWETIVGLPAPRYMYFNPAQ